MKHLPLICLISALTAVGLAGGDFQTAPAELPERRIILDNAPTGNSTTLSVIFNPGAEAGSRLKAVHSLSGDLPDAQISALCRFIKARPEKAEKNFLVLQLIKNDLLNVLMEQRNPSPYLTATMVDTYQDQGQDPVTRDYVLQHLVTWYERGAAVDSDAKPQIRIVLQQAVLEDSSRAGTALLGMHRLAMEDPAFDRNEISERALALANSTRCVEAQITAIQICAEEGMAGALPLIRSLALARSPTALRISAIAALGRLGNAQDVISLERLAPGSGLELRPAIEAALRRLRRELHLQKVV